MWRRRATVLLSRITPRASSEPSWLPPLRHYSFAHNKKGKSAPLQERQMRDMVRVWAKGGEGGNGCWSYRRSRTDRYGKPDGGNGGRGGDVLLECSENVWDFRNMQHHLNAKSGGHGVSKKKAGSRGSDKVVHVPVGTVVHLVNGEIPSFVEDTPLRSLQPWEIPEAGKSGSSKSPRCNTNNIGSSSLSEDDTDGSPWPFHKVPKTRDHIKPRGNRNFRNFQFVEDNTKIKYEEYAEDTDELESEAENEGCTEEDQEEDEQESEEDHGDDSEGENCDEECEEEEEEVQYSVAELTKPGQKLIVARGGEGGLGNAVLRKGSKYSITHKNSEDHDNSNNTELDEEEEHYFSLTAGMPGSESVLILELKSIADVGLVGMPNAGKSTLLGAISRAKPAVGHYAFTTLRPNLGDLNYDDFFSLTVADIPGLIKGAHENRGLGHAFLRHIERTKVLAYVVDLAATLNGGKGIVAWEQLRDLVLELEHHQEGLSQRPSLVVANKIDEEGAEEVLEELKRRVKGVPIFPVCAVLEEGVAELKEGLRRLMDGSESEFEFVDLNRIMLD